MSGNRDFNSIGEYEKRLNSEGFKLPVQGVHLGEPSSVYERLRADGASPCIDGRAEVPELRPVFAKYRREFMENHDMKKGKDPQYSPERPLGPADIQYASGCLAVSAASLDRRHIKLHGLTVAKELSAMHGSHKLTNAIHMIGQRMTGIVDARIAEIRSS